MGANVRFSVRTSLLDVIAATIPLSFACGGDNLDKVDADDWVADICDAADDFNDDLERSAERLQVLGEGDPDDIKEAIDKFANDAKEAIDGFVKQVQDIGQPDIDGGGKVVQAIRNHARDEQRAIDDFRDEVNDLDIDDEDDFRDEVVKILSEGPDLDLRDRLEDIDEDEVDDLMGEIDEDSQCSAALFSS